MVLSCPVLKSEGGLEETEQNGKQATMQWQKTLWEELQEATAYM